MSASALVDTSLPPLSPRLQALVDNPKFQDLCSTESDGGWTPLDFALLKRLHLILFEAEVRLMTKGVLSATYYMASRIVNDDGEDAARLAVDCRRLMTLDPAVSAFPAAWVQHERVLAAALVFLQSEDWSTLKSMMMETQTEWSGLLRNMPWKK